jgi:hypothetical protein
MSDSEKECTISIRQTPDRDEGINETNETKESYLSQVTLSQEKAEIPLTCSVQSQFSNSLEILRKLEIVKEIKLANIIS